MKTASHNTILTGSIVSDDRVASEELDRLQDRRGWLEVRADLLSDDHRAISQRRSFSGKAIYALRSNKLFGAYEGGQEERIARLRQASQHFDLIELDSSVDLVEELTEHIPCDKRIIVHKLDQPVDQALQSLQQFRNIGARYYKFIAKPTDDLSVLLPLQLLQKSKSTDVIVCTQGALGLWTDILAPYFGSPMIYGRLGDHSPDAFTIDQLIRDYGFPEMVPFQEIYGITGRPVLGSLSPRLHNAAYRALDMPALFLPFHMDNFNTFGSELIDQGALKALGLTIKGMTVVSPFKEQSCQFADKIVHPVTAAARSCNLMVEENGHWLAGTTDAFGVKETIRQMGISVKGYQAAVIGAGGAGRAITVALQELGAEVLMVNRSPESGMRAAWKLGIRFCPLNRFKIKGFDLLVNATPIGKYGDTMPFDLYRTSGRQLIIDMAYASQMTPLVKKALLSGIPVIDGRSMLITQVREQFRKMTGRIMPVELARDLASLPNTQNSPQQINVSCQLT